MESATSGRATTTGTHAAAARNFEGVEALPEPAARDWSELHIDALSLVFTKLGAIEVLIGAGLVCHSWLDTAKLPDLWRSVDLSNHEVLEKMDDSVLCAMGKMAADRSRGQLETFAGKGFVTNDLLKHIGDMAPSLKGLRLISCYNVSNVGITETIKKFPLLDDLELSFCVNVSGKYVFETIGKSCTRLTRFKKCEDSVHTFACPGYRDWEAMGIVAMTHLRSLQLFGNKFGNKGLVAILDNCPHLESLDIRHCFNITMGNKLKAILARIKTLRLPNDSTTDYQYPVYSPFWMLGIESESDDYDYDYSDDYYDHIVERRRSDVPQGYAHDNEG